MKLYRSKFLSQTAPLVLAVVLVCIIAGCSQNEPATPEPETKQAVKADPVFRDETFSVLSGRIAAGGGSETIAEITETGLMIVAIDCDRPPLCYRNEYGIALGFEVDLLRQTAAFFGAKLNVVAPGESAHISGPVPATDEPGDLKTKPYFYSSKTGWLALQIHGDTRFATTLDMVIDHLYDTGTYQQLYQNWFDEEESEGAKSEAE